MLSHDRDEELTLFLEMRRREKENRESDTVSSNGTSSSSAAATAAVAAAALLGVTETVSSQRYRRTAAENFLYSENEKSDYDWLLTPPGTPQFDKESHRNTMNQLDAPNSRPTLLKSRLGNCREETISTNNTKLQTSSSLTGLRRPTSSGSSRSTSRPSTPTRRSTTSTANTTTTKPSTSRSSTPTSRATLTASRASTLTTSHATLTAARATTTTTSTAPTRTMTRSMTRPSSAPSSPRKKPGSRPATPTRRPSTPTGPPIVSSKATKPVSSRGTSPITRSTPWKPPEMPGFSLDAPPNLRTTLADRPVSASRGRSGASAPNSRSSSIERGTAGIIGGSKRQSCSPSRGRAAIGNGTNVSQGRGKVVNNCGSSDSLSPVAMGNKMVERVVNMRKLGPPRLTETNGGVNGKSNSLGYGRNLSKSSIDMALRHMDIRRGMTGNLRPLVTKVPASSMYSVRAAGTARSRPSSRPGSRAGSATDSPLATSSSVSSSELSVNILCLDGNEAENDDLLSEKNYFSPRNHNLKFKS